MLETFFAYGAMYAKLEPGQVIPAMPVQLGEHFIEAGTLISQIGSKRRTMFAMKDGHYLQYRGMIDRILLFKSYPNEEVDSLYYYAFHYIDNMTLLQGGSRGCRDIKTDLILFKE